MLVSWDRALRLALVWSFDPVPSSISVSSEPPSVGQAALVGGPTSETDHHSGGASGLAKGGRVVHPHSGCFLPTIELDPREGSLFNTELPDVVDCLLAGVTSEHEQVGLRENNGVSISPARGRAHNGDDHPLGLILSISHVK